MKPKRQRRQAVPRMTLEQLRSFAAVASREHVTEAAAALGLSQAAVSEQVHALERALGVALLERVGRRVRLTGAGRDVQRLTIPVLDGVRGIEALAGEHAASPRGPLRLGAGHVLAVHRLTGWLRPFVDAHPGVDIEITLGDRAQLLDRLGSGAIDCAVVTGATPAGEGIQTLVLEQTELVLVVAASHPLASDPEARQRHRHLAHEHGSGTEALARRLLGDEPPANRVIELEEGALLAALRAGLGWAAMPRAVIEPDLASGILAVIPHRGPRVVGRFCALRRTGPRSRLEELLWTHLSGIAQSA